MKTLAVIGGDSRQRFLCSELQRRGYPVRTFGIEAESGSLATALGDADAVILPVPATRDGEHIQTPLVPSLSLSFSAILPYLSPRVRLLGGMVPREWATALEERGIRVDDYFHDETFQLRNALPTAEGAIRLAMEALPVTLFGTRVAVIGYGRIGSLLAERLTVFGARVSVFARSPVARANARLHGTDAETAEAGKLCLPSDCRVVFNTVPSRILDADGLRALPHGCVMLELASAPGGFDPHDAERAGLHVISAPGLPGRFYPESAGTVLADTVCAILDADG